MRVPGRLAAAIEILGEVEAQRRPVAQVLKDWGHTHRFAGSGDRAGIANLVYDGLRYRRSFAAYMDDDSPRAVILATAQFLPGYCPDGLPEFAGDPHAPGALSNAEKRALERPFRRQFTASSSPHTTQNTSTDAPEPARIQADENQTGPDETAQSGPIVADCPDWVWPSMMRVFGDQATREVAAMAARAPLDLRLNPFASKPERVDKSLARHRPIRDAAVPFLRRIAATQGFERAAPITSQEAYQKGWVEVQDAGSQLAAEMALAGLTPRTVLDYCTGGGGKALALSVLMGGRGQVFAHDKDRRRMKDIWTRIKRAKAHNIQTIDPDAMSSHAVMESGADCVVVDAPCTGTGTWRRHPDTKWRLSHTALTMRLEEQQTVLDQAARLTKPGGRLAYITCSVLAEENEDQISAFLHRHAGFRPLAHDHLLQNLARREPAEKRPAVRPAIPLGPFQEGDLGLRLTPAITQTDGFFVACLEREQ